MTNTDTPRPRMPLVPGPAGTTARKETAGLTQHAPVNIAVAQGGQVDKMQSSASPLARMPGPTGKISKAIANCMKEVGTIKKRGVNEFFNYTYPSGGYNLDPSRLGQVTNLVTNTPMKNDYYTWEITGNRRMASGWSRRASTAGSRGRVRRGGRCYGSIHEQSDR